MVIFWALYFCPLSFWLLLEVPNLLKVYIISNITNNIEAGMRFQISSLKLNTKEFGNIQWEGKYFGWVLRGAWHASHGDQVKHMNLQGPLLNPAQSTQTTVSARGSVDSWGKGLHRQHRTAPRQMQRAVTVCTDQSVFKPARVRGSRSSTAS